MFLRVIEQHGIKLSGAIVALSIIGYVEWSDRDLSGEMMSIIWLSLNSVIWSVQGALKRRNTTGTPIELD